MWTFGGKGTGTSQWGLMVGSVFERVLSDLEREIDASRGRNIDGAFGGLGNASDLEALAVQMRQIHGKRVKRWLAMAFPYGSEFPWDSTGHEEIHTWLMREQQHAAANKTVGAVLAYMALLPTWANSGSARRYWDYVINGKTSIGNEREFHHYGSTLNAVAVLDSYRAYPRRGYLLRLGMAALIGHLSNIFPSGAASMAWHGDPTLLRRDGYSGDYGIGLYGYWRSAAAYLDCSMTRGWECMYCDFLDRSTLAGTAVTCSEHVRLVPRDAFGRRLYVAPLGFTVSVEGARLVEAEFDAARRTVLLSLQKHETAPSSEASVFIRGERAFPPLPMSVAPSALRASCSGVTTNGGKEACAREGLRDGFRVRLNTGPVSITRVKIEPQI